MNTLHRSLSNKLIKSFWAQNLLILLVAAGTARTAQAASGTWTGLSPTDANWTSTANWTATPVPGSGETATFDSAGNGRTLVNVGNVTIKFITFDTATAAAYTLGNSAGTGTFTWNSAGAITVNSTVTNNQTINSNIVTSVSGGDSFINNSTAAELRIAGNVTLATGSGAANRTFNVAGAGATTISGNVSNGASTFSLGLVKSGTGTLTLSGTNSYTGTTSVSGAGTLIIDGNQSLATGAVSIATTSTLSGSGTVGGATTITNGILSAGSSASAGNLSFSNSLTLVGASVNSVFDIAGSARGALGGYDAITIDAASLLTYSGALTLNITSLLAPDTFDLFSFGTGLDAGGFSSVVLTGGAYTGYSFSQTAVGSGIWVASNAGNTFTFTESTGDLTLVPEPSTWALLILGLVSVQFVARRNRRAHSA